LSYCCQRLLYGPALQSTTSEKYLFLFVVSFRTKYTLLMMNTLLFASTKFQTTQTINKCFYTLNIILDLKNVSPRRGDQANTFDESIHKETLITSGQEHIS